MKNESQFNTVVKDSILAAGGFAHKISDAGRMTHGTLPFDIFGSASDKMIVCESKFNKECMSLNLKRLEDHQIQSLLQVYETFPSKDHVCAIFMVGVVFGRNDIRAFWWKNEELYTILQRREDGNNILKKEFMANTRYEKVTKGLIDFKRILES